MALLGFFSRPLGVAIAWAGTVTGAISGFYFYEQSKASRELSFYVAPAPTQIVRFGQSSKLTVAFNGQPVSSDISATQITIWNAGKLSIHKENVLKPVEIITNDHTPILEATLRANSRDVTGVALDLSKLPTGYVGVSWNILEQNDGLSIQIIFAGSPDTKLSAEGVIEGQAALVRAPVIEQRSTWRRLGPWVLIAVYMGFVLLTWWVDRVEAAHGGSVSKWQGKTRWAVAICAGGLTIIQAASLWPSRSRPPDSLTSPSGIPSAEHVESKQSR